MRKMTRVYKFTVCALLLTLTPKTTLKNLSLVSEAPHFSGRQSHLLIAEGQGESGCFLDISLNEIPFPS